MTNSTRSCPECGNEVTGHSNRVYCSAKCRTRFKSKVGGPTCSSCGDRMSRGTRRPGAKSMCKACREASYVHGTYRMYSKRKCRCGECRAAATEYMREYTKRYTAKNGISPTARSRRIAKGQPVESLVCAKCGEPMKASRHVEGVTPMHKKCRGKFYISAEDRQKVYERDNWMCHLCGERCDPGADWFSDWFPSLDHIVPRSMGGTEDMDNLATCHRWCNSVRGVEPLEDLLVV